MPNCLWIDAERNYRPSRPAGESVEADLKTPEPPPDRVGEIVESARKKSKAKRDKDKVADAGQKEADETHDQHDVLPEVPGDDGDADGDPADA